MATQGPAVRRRQLGKALRRLREAANISTEAAAAHLDRHRTHLTHLETGYSPAPKAELESLLRLYGADEATMQALEEIRQEASERGWWSTFGLPTWLADLVGLEDDAIAERVFAGELIPALVQTPEYAEVLHLLEPRVEASQEVTRRRVEVRTQRQLCLRRPEQPLQYSAVLSEAALDRTAVAPVGVGQLRRLISDMSLPNVNLQVLPTKIGLHAGMSGSFIVLDFPADVAPSYAFRDLAAGGGHLVDDPRVVQFMSDLHDELCNQALSSEESLEMVRDRLRKIER